MESPQTDPAAGIWIVSPTNGLFSGVLRHLNGLVRMSQELVPPLIIQGLTALVLGAEPRHWLALQALQHNPGVGLGIPVASLHG
jgi:hypothetical protein